MDAMLLFLITLFGASITLLWSASRAENRGSSTDWSMGKGRLAIAFSIAGVFAFFVPTILSLVYPMPTNPVVIEAMKNYYGDNTYQSMRSVVDISNILFPILGIAQLVVASLLTVWKIKEVRKESALV